MRHFRSAGLVLGLTVGLSALAGDGKLVWRSLEEAVAILKNERKTRIASFDMKFAVGRLGSTPQSERRVRERVQAFFPLPSDEKEARVLSLLSPALTAKGQGALATRILQGSVADEAIVYGEIRSASRAFGSRLERTWGKSADEMRHLQVTAGFGNPRDFLTGDQLIHEQMFVKNSTLRELTVEIGQAFPVFAQDRLGFSPLYWNGIQDRLMGLPLRRSGRSHESRFDVYAELYDLIREQAYAELRLNPARQHGAAEKLIQERRASLHARILRFEAVLSGERMIDVKSKTIGKALRTFDEALRPPVIQRGGADGG